MNKCCMMLKIVKLRISKVHSIIEFKKSSNIWNLICLEDKYDEDAYIEILISKNQLDETHPGYQKPITSDQARDGKLT